MTVTHARVPRQVVDVLGTYDTRTDAADRWKKSGRKLFRLGVTERYGVRIRPRTTGKKVGHVKGKTVHQVVLVDRQGGPHDPSVVAWLADLERRSA